MTSEHKAPEFEPPAACVGRILKAALPDNIQITKDARAAFARAAGIYIFYLTHCANDFCHEHKRQTIYTQDVLSALKELDFEEFVGPIEEFLEAYRKENEVKKATKKNAGESRNVDEGEAEEEDNANNDDDGGMEEDEDNDE